MLFGCNEECDLGNILTDLFTFDICEAACATDKAICIGLCSTGDPSDSPSSVPSVDLSGCIRVGVNDLGVKVCI